MFEQQQVRQVQQRLTELNDTFIRLATRIQRAGGGEQPVFGLDGRLAHAVANLSETRVKDLARCPYPLYSLRLNDPGFWSPATPGAWTAALAAPTEDPPDEFRVAVCGFTHSALLYSWHVCATSIQLARITLGLSPRCAGVFASLPISRLQNTALHCPGLLRAAHADNPRFWPDLIACVASGTPQQRSAAKLLGLQLQATRSNREPA